MLDSVMTLKQFIRNYPMVSIQRMKQKTELFTWGVRRTYTFYTKNKNLYYITQHNEEYGCISCLSMVDDVECRNQQRLEFLETFYKQGKI